MAILNPEVKASRSEIPFNSIFVAQYFSSSSFCSSESVSSNSALFWDCLCCSSRYSWLFEIWIGIFQKKKAGTKKTGEIFRNLPFFSAVWLAKRLFSLCGSILTTQHRASLQNRCTPHFFQNRAGLFCFWIDLSLGETGACKWPQSSGVQCHACKRGLCR